MKKTAIEKMTKKAVIEALENMNIHADLRISTKDVTPVRKPGVIGICETKKHNLMVYMINENGRMYNTSVHTNRREANGRVFQRVLAANA